MICSDVVCQRGKKNLTLREDGCIVNIESSRRLFRTIESCESLKSRPRGQKHRTWESSLPSAHVFEMCAENSPPRPAAIPVSFFSSLFFKTLCSVTGTAGGHARRRWSSRFFLAVVVQVVPTLWFPTRARPELFRWLVLARRLVTQAWHVLTFPSLGAAFVFYFVRVRCLVLSLASLGKHIRLTDWTCLGFFSFLNI